MSFTAWRLVCLLVVGALGPQASAQAKDQPESNAALFTEVHVDAYDCGQHRLAVDAARGQAGTRRFGFLHTALLPTLELEDVAVQWVRDDGTQERMHLPTATIDWTHKTILTPAGQTFTPLSRQPRLPKKPHLLQDVCVG